MRILLVDDESLVLETLAPFLQRCGHDVLARSSATEAKVALGNRGGAFDLLITDVCMPGRDGLQLLGAVREIYPDIDVVLITALSQVSDVRQAVEAGAAGFLRKPVKLHELRHLIERVAESRADRTRIHRLAVSLDAERSLHDTVVRERMFARRLHQRIFPSDFTWLRRTEVALRHLPQAGLGGDYMDVRPYGPGKALVMVADVSGHGTPAAFGGIALKTWFCSIETGLSPLDVLARADQVMRDLFPSEFYATAFCALYDEITREISFASAGHPRPVVLKQTGSWRALDSLGSVLGTPGDHRRELCSTVLGDDEVLLAYSDGLAQDLLPIAEGFGTGCQDWIRSHPTELPGLLTCALDMATAADPLRAFSDDISLLALRPRPARGTGRALLVAGKRVLHIEDDPVVAAVISSAVGQLGLGIEHAPTWAAASAMLDRGRPDLVILDLVLPDAAGATVFRELRRRFPHLPVLVVTGNELDRAVRQCFDLNPAGILTKPVDLRALESEVAAALHFDPDHDLVAFDNLGNEWFDFVIASSPASVELLTRYLQALGRQPLPAEVLNDVVICIREMAMNGIEWGNRFDPTLRVRVSTLIMADRVMVKIADEGSGFDTHRLFEPFDPLGVVEERERQGKRCGGFGLAMVQAMMSRVEFNQRGNVVLLVKEITP